MALLLLREVEKELHDLRAAFIEVAVEVGGGAEALGPDGVIVARGAPKKVGWLKLNT